MENLIVVAALALALGVAASFVLKTARHILIHWSRTTTIFFWVVIVVLVMLIVSRW